jgi:aquaporin Z
MIGVMLLVIAINLSGGNVAAIGMTLFVILILVGPISGGHVNPAVSIGVLINQGINTHNFVMFLVMTSGQFLGGAISAYVCDFLLAEGAMAEKFPELKPNTPKYWQSFMIEAIGTMIFVGVINCVKDPKIEKHVTAGNGWMGCVTVAVTLTAVLMIAGPRTGGSINPAVSLSQNILKFRDNADLKHDINDPFWGVYMLGPYIGGTVAGLLSLLHRYAIVNRYEPAAESVARKPAAPDAENQQANNGSGKAGGAGGATDTTTLLKKKD